MLSVIVVLFVFVAIVLPLCPSSQHNSDSLHRLLTGANLILQIYETTYIISLMHGKKKITASKVLLEFQEPLYFYTT